jgi:hypothetical protein
VDVNFYAFDKCILTIKKLMGHHEWAKKEVMRRVIKERAGIG